MGIVIIPVMLGAAICYVISVYHLIKGIKNKIFNTASILIGILIPILILGGQLASWASSGRMYAFDPIFNFSFVLFILPIGLYLALRNNYKPVVTGTMKILIIIVFFSGTSLIFFGTFLNDYIASLNLEITH